MKDVKDAAALLDLLADYLPNSLGPIDWKGLPPVAVEALPNYMRKMANRLRALAAPDGTTVTEAKEAAERIVKYTSADSGSKSDEDAVTVARFVLSMADASDEGRAREIVYGWSGDMPPERSDQVEAITTALSAVRAQERERCAGIADNFYFDEKSASHPAAPVAAAIVVSIAAAIRGDHG